MGVNSLPKTVTRQHHGWDFNPGPSVPESSTLTTRLPSQPTIYALSINRLINNNHIRTDGRGVGLVNQKSQVQFSAVRLMSNLELSMGPFCVTRHNPTHQLTDPTQPNPTQPTTSEKNWSQPDPTQY